MKLTHLLPTASVLQRPQSLQLYRGARRSRQLSTPQCPCPHIVAPRRVGRVMPMTTGLWRTTCSPMACLHASASPSSARSPIRPLAQHPSCMYRTPSLIQFMGKVRCCISTHPQPLLSAAMPRPPGTAARTNGQVTDHGICGPTFQVPRRYSTSLYKLQ